MCSEDNHGVDQNPTQSGNKSEFSAQGGAGYGEAPTQTPEYHEEYKYMSAANATGYGAAANVNPTQGPDMSQQGQPSASEGYKYQGGGKGGGDSKEAGAAQMNTQSMYQPFDSTMASHMSQMGGQPMQQPFGVPTGQPMGGPVAPDMGQINGHPMYQPMGQPQMGQIPAQPMGQPMYQPMGQPQMGQMPAQPMGQPMYQPMGQPQMGQMPAQTMGQPMYQPMGQPQMGQIPAQTMGQPMYQPFSGPMDAQSGGHMGGEKGTGCCNEGGMGMAAPGFGGPGGMFGVFEEMINNNPQLSSLNKLVSASNSDLFKGIMIGAGVALLLSSDSIKDVLGGMVSGLFNSADESEIQEEENDE